MDVRNFDHRVGRGRVARIAFRQLYEIGTLLCAPVRLYGHYAFLVDYTYAVSAATICGTTKHVRFGGEPVPTDAAWVGLRKQVWTALGMTPHLLLGDIGVVQPDRV